MFNVGYSLILPFNTLNLNLETIDAVVVTGDVKIMFSGSWDRSIKVWDPNNYKHIRTFEKAHDGKIKGVDQYSEIFVEDDETMY